MAAVLVTVQAVADFRHHDRNVRAGELVTMRALDAVAAHRLGRVSLTRPPRAVITPRAAAPDPSAPDPSPAPASRRKYRRRDLEPEA